MLQYFGLHYLVSFVLHYIQLRLLVVSDASYVWLISQITDINIIYILSHIALDFGFVPSIISHGSQTFTLDNHPFDILQDVLNSLVL